MLLVVVFDIIKYEPKPEETDDASPLNILLIKEERGVDRREEKGSLCHSFAEKLVDVVEEDEDEEDNG